MNVYTDPPPQAGIEPLVRSATPRAGEKLKHSSRLLLTSIALFTILRTLTESKSAGESVETIETIEEDLDPPDLMFTSLRGESAVWVRNAIIAECLPPRPPQNRWDSPDRVAAVVSYTMLAICVICTLAVVLGIAGNAYLLVSATAAVIGLLKKLVWSSTRKVETKKLGIGRKEDD
jgi:hypothetical protein